MLTCDGLLFALAKKFKFIETSKAYLSIFLNLIIIFFWGTIFFGRNISTIEIQFPSKIEDLFILNFQWQNLLKSKIWETSKWQHKQTTFLNTIIPSQIWHQFYIFTVVENFKNNYFKKKTKFCEGNDFFLNYSRNIK